jgi:deoxyribonuclease-4
LVKKPPPRVDAGLLLRSPVPPCIHAPYLINVASANTRVRIPARKILQDTCDGAAAINATAVIVHGGHADDSDIAAGSPVICETADGGRRNDIAFLRELCG